MRPPVRRPAGAALAIALAAMAAAPAAATASTTVSNYPVGQSTPPDGDPFGLVIHGDAEGALVNIRMLETPTRFRTAVLRPDNSFAPTVTGSGCTTVTSAVECNEGGTLLATAFLGDGNDSISENSTGVFFAFLDARGEGGDDRLTGGRGKDKLDGGTGDDTLDSATGTGNTLAGGDGDDTLTSREGGDTLDGDAGADTLTGGAGNDTLNGDAGNDSITGGPGADTIRGGTGSDSIDARDGVADTLVDCGGSKGFTTIAGDSVTADLSDNPVGCSTLFKFAIDDGPPSAPVGSSLAIKADGSAQVRVACPKNAKVRCRGTLTVRDPRKAARILDSASYDIGAGAGANVGVTLTRSQQALLRSRGAALVMTLEKGKSKKGPRSSQRVLAVSKS